MRAKRSSDRHRAESAQLNLRVPRALRAEFARACEQHGRKQTEVLEALLRGFVQLAGAEPTHVER